MPLLRKLLAAIKPVDDLAGIPDQHVATVTCDSRLVRPGSIFVALRGEKQDGHAYIEQAVRKGSCAVVVEREMGEFGATPVIRVTDSHLAYGQLAAAFYGYPGRELTVIGLTGTNGKTTTSWIVEEMLRTAGIRVGVIGTVNYRYTDAAGRTVVREAPLTTPEPMALQGLMREMRQAGVSHLVMEVSSHALAQQRLTGLQFSVGVFTNLSRDHLDFHGSMEAYFAAKQILFTRLLRPDGVAVVVTGAGGRHGADDWGQRLLAVLRQDGFGDFGRALQGRKLITCGMGRDCPLRAVDFTQDLNGFQADILLGGRKLHLRSGLIGSHNVLNMLAATGVGIALGLSPERVISGLEGVPQVPGRLEQVLLPHVGQDGNGPRVIVDYAHSPDALENVLRTLRQLTPGRLFCVFGCGGDRDRGKRPMMGRVAAALADRLVITSDNPRSEDPAVIISEIEAGVQEAGAERTLLADLSAGGQVLKKYSVLADRRHAIHRVCSMAGAGDVVLIAGKGHETYQIIGPDRQFFDDRLEAKNSVLRWTVDRLLQATGGTLCQRGDSSLFGEISTDTRTLRQGDVFLALQGENYDGHDFVGQALAKGAACLVVSRSCPEVVAAASVIRVGDTLRAYQDLAHHRRALLISQLQVVAITGSSGKTTVKEMAAAIFNMQYGSAPSEAVLKTEGNLNNLVGLPRTLLQAHAGHRVAVLEMGMNRPGEIRRLTETADPDIGCINNVQAAHLEGLGSIAGVARAKGELFAAMRPDSIAIVNFDDARIRALAQRYQGRVVSFAATAAGRKFGPDVRAVRIASLGEAGMRFTLQIGDWRQRLTVPATGAHNVSNCVAAAAIATAAGIVPEVIARGLAGYSSGDKRLQIVALPGGISVLNDSYNANPASMAAALKTVSTFGREGCRRVAALGDMLELGQGAAEAHRVIGALVAKLGLDYLAVTGEHAPLVAEAAQKGGMERQRIRICAGTAEAASWLAGLIERNIIGEGDWVLLKGSRGMRMERVLAVLAQLLAPHGN